MSTIELGEISPAADDGGPDQPGRRGFDRRLMRQVGLGAVAVLCAGLTGSAVPGTRGVRPLWSMSVARSQSLALTGDSVFVQRTTGDRSSVTAYTLATGAVRWQRSFAGTIGYLQAVDQAGMLLVPADGRAVPLEPGDPDVGPDFHRQTVAVSTATGAELWRTAGEPAVVTADTALMTEHEADGDVTRMRVIRLGDHRTVWGRAVPGARNQVVAMAGTRPDKVITATGRGEIRIFSYATGALVSSARIPWVTPRPEDGYFNDLTTSGGYLVVNRARSEIFEMSVYRMDTMAEVWRARDTNGYAFTCASSLCLNYGGGLVAHDPATGRVRWRLDDVTNAQPVGADRLLLDDGAEDGRQVLVDATTGTRIDEARGSTAWTSEPYSWVLLLRSTTSPADRTSITRWDLGTGRRSLLGSIDAMLGYRCQAVPGYLTCTRGDAFEVTAVG